MKRSIKRKIRSIIDVVVFVIIILLAACGDSPLNILASLFLIASGIIIILLLIKGALK